MKLQLNFLKCLCNFYLGDEHTDHQPFLDFFNRRFGRETEHRVALPCLITRSAGAFIRACESSNTDFGRLVRITQIHRRHREFRNENKSACWQFVVRANSLCFFRRVYAALATALGFKPSVAMLQVRKRQTLRRWGRVSYRLAYRICSTKMLIFADWSRLGRRCLSMFGRRFGCSWIRCVRRDAWAVGLMPNDGKG